MKEGYTIKFEPYFVCFVILAGIVLVLELSLTMNKPVAFGDEAYHGYIAKYIGTTHTFPKELPGFGGLYTYSPLFHLLLSTIYSLPQQLWFLAKAFVPLISFGTGIAMFVLLSKLYNERVAFIASAITISLPIFMMYSVLIYTDVLMVGFFIISAICAMLAEKLGTKKYWILAALFATLSYMSKTTGAISFFFIGILLIYKLIKKEMDWKRFSVIVLISIGIVVALAGWWIVRNYIDFKAIDCNAPYFLYSQDCIKQTDIVSKNNTERFAGYVSPGTSNQDIFHFGIKQFIVFMYGNMIAVPLLVSCGVVFFLMRKEKNDVFLLVLLGLSILPMLMAEIPSSFTMRAEDVGRYMMVTTVVISMIAAVWLDTVFKEMEKYKKWMIYFSIVIMIVLIVFLWFNFKAKFDVMSKVKTFSPMFFEACDWIKANTPKDATFLSLWAAPTVYNCERTAKWSTNDQADIVLSNDMLTVLNGLQNQNMSYIFIQKFAMSQTPYITMIPYDFVARLESQPTIFIKVFENGPPLKDCIDAGGCDGTIVYKLKE